MKYTKRLLRDFFIVKALLAAIVTVFVCKFVLAEWITGFERVWELFFGLSLTTLHVAVWAALLLLTLSSFGKILDYGGRYTRTPAVVQLLLPEKVFWFVACIAVVLIIPGLLEGWDWKCLIPNNYSAVIVPAAYAAIGILLPFGIGCAMPKRRKHVPPAWGPEMQSTPLVEGDEPIKTGSEDRLSRSAFIEQMYNIIANYKTGSSLVIGLSGEWGSGKTSSLNLLKEKLKMEDAHVIIVDFNPWFFRDDAALIREFFASIGNQLESEYLIPGFSKYKQYVSKLLQSTTATIGPIGLSFTLGTDGSESEIRLLKDGIENTLRAINRKVLILVDDIDRLPPRELLLMVKLVRLCGNFSSFIYVLCYDRRIIGELLNEGGVTDPDAFLDKIVNLDLRLPEVNKRSIDDYVGSKLDQLFQEFDISLDNGQQERLRNVYSNHITNRVQTLREAKKLLANLVGVLGAVIGEVNVVDTIALESLRIFASRVWVDIASSPDLYVLPLDTGYFTSRLLLRLGDNDNASVKTKEHLEGILLSEKDISREFAKGVVEFLFPRAADILRGQSPSYEHLQQDYEREQRVALGDHLRKYLLQHVPVGLISGAQIASIIEQANESSSAEETSSPIFDAFSSHQRAGVLYELIQKLIFLIDKLEQKGDAAMVKAICEYSDRFSGSTRGLQDSEMDRALVLLYAIANKYRDTDKIQEILKDVILKSKSMYFASSIISWCDPKHNHVVKNFDNVNKPTLKEAYTSRFKAEYIETKKDIFTSDASAVRYLIYPIEDSGLLTGYILSLFTQRPSNAGRLFLLYASDRYISNYPQLWIFQYDALKEKFDVERLYAFITAHKSETYENDDEKWAVEKFMELYKQSKEHQEGLKN